MPTHGKRFGFIAPATCETTVIELYRMIAPEVTTAVSALRINHVSQKEVDQEIRGLERAAQQLADHGVDAIGISGAPIVFLQGPGADIEIANRVSQIAKVPAFYDVTAVCNGLRAVGAKRIAIVSPFSDTINAPMRRFFEAAGFDIPVLVGNEYSTNPQLRRVPPYIPYRAGRQAMAQAPDVDAIFITCAGWATHPAVEMLERDYGIPVIVQMQAVAWQASHMLGTTPQQSPRHGRLMQADFPGRQSHPSNRPMAAAE
jgi:maleate cis-trans isomerase